MQPELGLFQGTSQHAYQFTHVLIVPAVIDNPRGEFVIELSNSVVMAYACYSKIYQSEGNPRYGF